MTQRHPFGKPVHINIIQIFTQPTSFEDDKSIGIAIGPSAIHTLDDHLISDTRKEQDI